MRGEKSKEPRKLRLINNETKESMLLELTPNTLDVLEINRIQEKIKQKKKVKEKCYFCDFEYLKENHHIVNVANGGKEIKNNILYLCPNHHYLIHRTDFELIFCEGFFILFSQSKRKFIFPFMRESLVKKKCPPFITKYSILNNKIIKLNN